MPAKAALLIASSLKDGFPLPADKGPDWYGISPDSLQRGLKELRDHGLLSRSQHRKAAPLAKQGFTLESIYSLQAPFQKTRATTTGADILVFPTSA